ncbi:matrilin-3-like [Haliotis asinina]|uniref:matrilin-3-like n=1 Tax=Haliotis asinina TaxID=109174 RepID=UPI0035321A4C
MEQATAALLLLLFFCHSCVSQGTDPCKNYTLLENIENRDPSTSGRPLIINDYKLSAGWYMAPGHWELLNQDPGGTNRCGTQIPVYRQSKNGTTSVMCNKVVVRNCYRPFEISTRMCGTKEIYYLETSHRRSGFCFFNNDPCASNPCANGGRCKINRKLQFGYKCICVPGFRGRNCTICNRSRQDILIMEDVSLSVGRTTFDKVRQFQERLLSPLSINADTTNVAYMVFSTYARVVFGLSEYSNSKSGVLTALKDQVFERGSSTNIAGAINVAVNSVFTRANGDRRGAHNAVIMFTDGFATEENRRLIEDSIPRLHAKAEVYVVALSDVEANSTVYSMATTPGDVFRIHSSDAVSSLRASLKRCD